MSVVVGGGVVMVGGEWSWSWWVAVVVIRGEGVDGVSGGGWWGGHQGMGWSLGYGVVVVVVGHEGAGHRHHHVVVVRLLLLLLLWVREQRCWVMEWGGWKWAGGLSLLSCMVQIWTPGTTHVYSCME
jgi:hypothetical protein